MNRKVKNIVMISVAVLMIVLMALTGFYAKSHVSKSASPDMGGTMNNTENMDFGNNSGENNTPPEKPSDDSNNNGTPPEKPSDDSNNNGTPSEKPSDDNTEGEEPTNDSDSMSDKNKENTNAIPSIPNDGLKETTIDNVYIIIFSVEAIVLSLIIMYLIMSRFNALSLKETYKNKDKIIIYVLATIILSGAFTFASYKITNTFISVDNKSMNDNKSNVNYTASNEITEDTSVSEASYTSSNSDENALIVSGDKEVTLDNISVTKTGDSDGGDSTSFYGNNSAILAKDGATLNISKANISTDATGANGVFSYGGSATTNNSSSDGTTINISDSTITTTKDNSGGIMTTGGGNMNASNLTITTNGVSSAAIRTDRGGGNVTVDGGTYTTNGAGSPSIYSTANINVKNAKLVSNVSEGIVIEGKNSVTIENTTLTDTNNTLNGKSTTYKNIFLYQSMSGDASTGVSTFTAKNSKITTNKGDTFYVTNTSSEINLENNTIVNSDSTGNFLRVQKDSWGNNGSNGGDVTLSFTKQTASGSIVVDEISTLTFNLTSNSLFTGVVNSSNKAKSITLKLDKTSKIKLTGDTYVTTFENEDESNSNIDFNGYHLYVNGKAIN